MSRSRTLGLFLLVTVLFGIAFPAIKIGVADVPPLLFAAGRYYLSGLLLFVYAVGTNRRWRPVARNDWRAIAAGGTLLIGGTGLNFVGLQFTTSGIGAIIFALIPVLTVAASWMMLPAERASTLGILGVVVGLAGVTLVIDPESVMNGGETLLGNLLVLGAAVSIALGTVLVRRSRPAIGTVSLTAWAMVLGATIQVILSVATGESVAAITVTPAAVASLLYLAVLAGGIAFVIYFHLLDDLGPVQANMTSYLTPVVTVIVGWAILREPIPASALPGLGVILVGFLLLEEHEIAGELARFRGAAR